MASILALGGLSGLTYTYMQNNNKLPTNEDSTIKTTNNIDLKQPTYPNKNKVNMFGLVKDGEDGLIDKVSNDPLIANFSIVPVNKTDIVINHNTEKLAEMVQTQGLNLSQLNQPQRAMLSTRFFNKLTNDGQDKGYIPRKTTLDNVFMRLQVTQPVKSQTNNEADFAPAKHAQQIIY
jgi:hypothetical protein